MRAVALDAFGNVVESSDASALTLTLSRREREPKASPEAPEFPSVIPAYESGTSDTSTLWRTLAEFFAKTLNDHHYEY